MTNDLSEKKCIPCKGGIPALSKEQCSELINKLHSDWSLIDGETKLSRSVKTKDYKEAWEILNKISIIAEDEWHHPDLHLSFGSLNIKIWTHKINALVESDFVFAAKVDRVLR